MGKKTFCSILAALLFLYFVGTAFWGLSRASVLIALVAFVILDIALDLHRRIRRRIF